jgi:hypothetical protein
MNLFEAAEILGAVAGAVGGVLLCHGHGPGLALLASVAGAVVGELAGPFLALGGFLIIFCIHDGPNEAWLFLRDSTVSSTRGRCSGKPRGSE